MTTRLCRECGAAADYAKHLFCRSCYSLYQQAQRLKHLVKRRNEDKERPRRRPNPARDRDMALQRKFGITQEQYEAMLEAQGGVCKICLQEERKARHGVIMALAVDHDHETGKIRGLLCNNCNLGIGKFSDNVVYLFSAIDYLKETA